MKVRMLDIALETRKNDLIIKVLMKTDGHKTRTRHGQDETDKSIDETDNSMVPNCPGAFEVRKSVKTCSRNGIFVQNLQSNSVWY